jgi:Immunity protein 8
MKAEIKGFYSPDLDWGSEVPPVRNFFRILLQVFIGPVGGKGEDSFDITVCSLDYLSSVVLEAGIIDGRHHLILHSFDREKIESYITKRVASLESGSWEDLAPKLGRLGHWEFEDYE